MEGQANEGQTSPRLRRQCHSTFTQQEERLLQVLQLKLQQRRTREELASQGIMPPLKSPAAFHEQRRSLERARTEDYLKRKIRSRPERAELVRMHILEETSAEPSLQATQMKLKRARLADDLNEKIAQRPGPMELVEKNILPVDSSVKEAIIDNHVPYSALADNSSFDEDSSDALSPEQPGSQESLGSLPSPTEAKSVDQHQALPTSPTQYLVSLPTGAELNKFRTLSDQQIAKLANGVSSPAAKPAPTLIKQSQPKMARDKNQRNKKPKEPKSRVKKLKYHQYMPPDQKLEKATLPLDTAYSKLLQQQQLFLQLQILCQQQQHYNYQTILPAPPKQNNEHQASSGSTPVRPLTNSTSSSGPGVLPRQNSCTSTIKPPASLPSNLDDLKVAELKQELKLRALPVSGTKTDLIERLRNYQEQARVGGGPAVPTPVPTVSKTVPLVSKPTELVVAFTPVPVPTTTTTAAATVRSGEIVLTPAAKPAAPASTPPVSPAPSDRSVQSMEDSTPPELLAESAQTSPMQVACKEEVPCLNGVSSHVTLAPSAIRRGGPDAKDPQATIKDRMLQEKDKQIEELTRMLRQKQQLVEALRLQLDQEKRTQQQQQPAPSQLPNPPVSRDSIAVKQENPPSSCSLSGKSNPSGPPPSQAKPPRTSPSPTGTIGPKPLPIKTVTVKQEGGRGGCQQPAPAILLSSSQPNRVTTGLLRTIAQAQTPGLLTNGAGPHILLTVTPQKTDVESAPPPASPTKDQPTAQAVTSSPSQQQAQQTTPTTQSKQEPQTETMTQTGKKDQKVGLQLITGTSGAVLSYALSPQNLQPFFPNNVTESSLQTRVNNESSSPHKENSRSQEMDDLFDILIESGEISVNAKDATTSLNTPSPQSVSPTLAASSPQASLKVEPPSPQLLLEPITDSQFSNQESRLEDFLVSTTGVPLLSVDHDGTQPLSLIDDLHNQMLSSSSILEHPHSPMDTSDMHFTTDSTCLTLDLADTNLDSMEWLDLTMGGSSVGLAPLSSVSHSVFSTDFLDSHDLHLHWD
ncbi:myocardin-related transcription factor A-like [Hypanus sabinus]|uniref:myocardin-related transcription factor A-like n=1 Tax=Hypanus sabinus TaxID=79690 RepID=UPI0028C4749B|nr:myocardin-related transcription factor A-like [Hypanus sabinus]XP_059809691.1 myocardin-related transcription factor A-like [Hypanus sabinus]XP_059809692.1 myocardin-related transcription factor A-like [Hypanus sabinus]XP_059809693.1 myocardin-related transcription factor A-like [Hypanus sabinus]XP_059809695.1 myocardin-related transcription factor A-like [Hypanus sabinus]XP_059809696.1 myocardin-related transcription factor A-like [Hypanus sabinus]XP_059809697.1 myocardin-related transcri